MNVSGVQRFESQALGPNFDAISIKTDQTYNWSAVGEMNNVELDQLNEKKKPTDLRKGGIILIFIGFGLAGFGVLSIPILKSVGFLVSSLGIGLLVAGYIYPNESEEITKAVESFEK